MPTKMIPILLNTDCEHGFKSLCPICEVLQMEEKFGFEIKEEDE